MGPEQLQWCCSVLIGWWKYQQHSTYSPGCYSNFNFDIIWNLNKVIDLWFIVVTQWYFPWEQTVECPSTLTADLLLSTFTDHNIPYPGLVVSGAGILYTLTHHCTSHMYHYRMLHKKKVLDLDYLHLTFNKTKGQWIVNKKWIKLFFSILLS